MFVKYQDDPRLITIANINCSKLKLYYGHCTNLKMVQKSTHSFLLSWLYYEHCNIYTQQAKISDENVKMSQATTLFGCLENKMGKSQDSKTLKPKDRIDYDIKKT